jgi:hypothetical protein
MIALVREGPVSETVTPLDRPIEGLQRPMPARAAAGVGSGMEPRPP